jgi:hypothetical protein
MYLYKAAQAESFSPKVQRQIDRAEQVFSAFLNLFLHKKIIPKVNILAILKKIASLHHSIVCPRFCWEV